MAHPKRRQSRARRGKRRIHDVLTKIQLVRCSNCGTTIKPHRICPACGYYRGKQVIVGQSA